MKYFILLISLAFLSGCSTPEKEVERNGYKVSAKFWVDGELKSTPMVSTLEDSLAEIISTSDDESYGFKVMITDSQKDSFVMEVDYSYSRGPTSEGSNMKFKGKLGTPITFERDHTKIEFNVERM